MSYLFRIAVNNEWGASVGTMDRKAIVRGDKVICHLGKRVLLKEGWTMQFGIRNLGRFIAVNKFTAPADMVITRAEADVEKVEAAKKAFSRIQEDHP